MTNLNFEIGLITFLAISAVQLGLGTALGWLLQLGRHSPAADSEESGRAKVNEVLCRLYELTGSLGHNVDRHASRVESISKELALSQGKSDSEVQAAMLKAMSSIAEANQRLQGELSSAEKRLQEQAGQIETHMAAARTDALTGLANRGAFDDQLAAQLEHFYREKVPVGLIMFDVDHFKRFNDTYGHVAGDTVLRSVARILYRTMRDVNTVARYGGEEFAIIVPDGDTRRAAEVARAAIEASICEFEGTTLQVTISGGVAEAAYGDNPTMLIKRADMALYASKQAGRNRTHANEGHTCVQLTPAAENAAPGPGAKPAPAAPSNSPAVPVSQSTVAAQQPQATTDAADADPLTRVLDRHRLHANVDRQLAERIRTNAPLSIVLADVNGLHTLNEEFGMSTGDVILRAVTQFLMASLRDMDAIARYDGDRFALVLPQAGMADAVQVAERVRSAVNLCKLRVNEHEVRITISTGVTTAQTGDDADQLMKRASQALLQAKDSGRNRTCFHDGSTCQPADKLASAGPEKPVPTLAMPAAGNGPVVSAAPQVR